MLDAVEACCQHEADGEVGVAGGVGAAQLHAAVVALHLRDADQLAAVLAAPAHVAGSLVAAEAEIAVGQGIREGRQLPAVAEDARHEAAGDAVGGNVALKEVLAVHGQREVDVEAAAGLVGQRLRQEAGVEAVAGRHGPDDLLEQEDVVGGLEGAGVVEVNFILAVAVLVVAVLGGEAHLLHGQADVPADVLAGVQRRYVEIAACVDGAVAAKGGVVRLFHVAEELHHPALSRAPGQDGHGGQVGPEHQVALLHVHEARDGAAVEADAIFQRFGKVACQHGDVFLKAEDVTEREADKFYIVVLDEIEDVLLCRITHRCVSSEKYVFLKNAQRPASVQRQVFRLV